MKLLHDFTAFAKHLSPEEGVSIITFLAAVMMAFLIPTMLSDSWWTLPCYLGGFTCLAIAIYITCVWSCGKPG